MPQDASMIEGIQLWDGDAARGPVTLSWEGDRVAAAESSVDRHPGLSAIPGLVDTHVHLVGDASGRAADFFSWPLTTRPEEQVLHALAHARRALAGGVTTLRDLSADEVQFSLARALRDGLVEGPRVLAYGLVGMTAGHGDLFIPPAVSARKPTADGADACRALVRRWARAGADGIKVTTSGGVLSIGDRAEWRNQTDEELTAIVDEAHALGMRVAAHAHTPEGIRRALAHGVDSLEHATTITAEQADEVVERGLTIAPTLLINDRVAAGRGAGPEQAVKAQELVRRRDARLADAAARGADIVLGTDANGFHVAFGEQMTEVRAMADLFGWPAERALRAATSRAGAAVGEPGVGRLGPGSAADLVVMRGRPWERIEELDVSRIVAVVSRGRVVAGSLPRPA
jgi:imidazolonepropionase-like amidohydrolase